jgi:hypothetical protein
LQLGSEKVVLCVLALLKVIVVIAMERAGASPGHRPLYGLTSDFEIEVDGKRLRDFFLLV